MKVSFNGFNENVATFQTEENNLTGKVVMVTANGTVSSCEAYDDFCGLAISERSGTVAVQLNGYVKVKFSGNLYPGYHQLCADDYGGVITTDSGGRKLLVVDVDTQSKTAGIIL